MGGDSFFPTEDESSLCVEGPESVNSPLYSFDDEGLSGLTFGEIQGSDPRKSLIHDAAEKQRHKVYSQIWKSYDDVQFRIERLEEARSKVLSYTPGSWAENSINWDEHAIPKTTSLLLIGPKGSGKSSLVNKISQVLEDGLFTSARAQVSNSTLTEDGTYFCHQYLIPRGSGSFCLCDTRGLSNDTSENLKMLKCWRKKGVPHGELVKRESDGEELKARLKYKAQGLHSSSQRMAINFFVFVVNGRSVLEAMDGDDGTKRELCQQIATIFNDPVLSFKDDKPAVVVTHGDLLSLYDCVRIRFYLGELLRIHPAQQIFDIPESNDMATKLAILDMLIYCLEHAGRNLPVKKQAANKKSDLCGWLLLVVVILGVSMAIQLCGGNRLIIPTNKSESQGTQGCYCHSPTEESQENGVQASDLNHAPANQSQEECLQASHSCEPMVASPVIASSLPVAATGGVQASQSTDRAPGTGSPTSRPYAPSDESQKKDVERDHLQASQPQAPSNAPKKNGPQASHARVPTNKSKKNGATYPRKPTDARAKLEDIKVEWHRIQTLMGGAPDEAKVEWHKIRHLWGAPDEAKVEWHKIRHLWGAPAETKVDWHKT